VFSFKTLDEIMEMTLTMKPIKTPFRVGETVYANIPYSSLATTETSEWANDQGYFEALIVRIFLEGLKPLSIISEPKEDHELMITNIIYDLKPLGKHKGSNRVALNVDVESKSILLFATEKELLDYYNKESTTKKE
jgi:hypothetical protein